MGMARVLPSTMTAGWAKHSVDTSNITRGCTSGRYFQEVTRSSSRKRRPRNPLVLGTTAHSNKTAYTRKVPQQLSWINASPSWSKAYGSV